MQQNEDMFSQFKIQTITKLQNAIKKNEVDEKVRPILQVINDVGAYVTTSSCAGRIILMQLPEIGDKKHAIFLGRWHRPIKFSEMKDVLETYEEGQLWFIAQSPIFHIAAKTINDADDLVKLGISSGFKNSGFKTGKKRIILELCSTERMDVPIAINKTIYVSDEYLQLLLEFGNELLIRSQKKLERLLTMLKTREENIKNGGI